MVAGSNPASPTLRVGLVGLGRRCAIGYFNPHQSSVMIAPTAMRVWKRPARSLRRPVDYNSLSGPINDAFISAAHDEPQAAIRMLTRDRQLAGARSSWGETAVQAASHLGQHELLRRLIKAGAHPDLFAACALGDRATSRALLPDADPAACGVHGLPILHFGVMSGDPGMLGVLIDYGVDLNPTGASLSALHSAVAIGSVPMIRALVTAGIDCNVEDAFGATALDWAYDVGDRGSVLAVLLAAGLRRGRVDLRTAG